MFILFVVTVFILLRHHAGGVVLSYGTGLEPPLAAAYSALDIGMTYGECWTLSHVSATAYISCTGQMFNCPGPVNLCEQSGHQAQVQLGVRLLVKKDTIYRGECGVPTEYGSPNAHGACHTRTFYPRFRTLRVEGPGCPPFDNKAESCPPSVFAEYNIVEIGRMNVTSEPSSYLFENLPPFKVCVPHTYGQASSLPVIQLFGSHSCGGPIGNVMQYNWDLRVEVQSVGLIEKHCPSSVDYVPADDCCVYNLGTGTYKENNTIKFDDAPWSIVDVVSQRNLSSEYEQWKRSNKRNTNLQRSHAGGA